MKNIAFCIIITLLISCDRIRKTKDKMSNTVSEILQEPIIEDYSLFDKFPEFERNEFKINEIKGIKCEYMPYFYKYYFKYSGDRELIQQYISNIQCHYNEITPDTAFIESDFVYFEKEVQCSTEYEASKSQFFYAYKDLDL